MNSKWIVYCASGNYDGEVEMEMVAWFDSESEANKFAGRFDGLQVMEAPEPPAKVMGHDLKLWKVASYDFSPERFYCELVGINSEPLSARVPRVVHYRWYECIVWAATKQEALDIGCPLIRTAKEERKK